MRNLILATVACGVLGIAAFAAQQPAQPAQPAPPPRQAQPTPSADPYANNPNPGATQFPLAAPAGKDSSARTTAPAGAVNTGAVRSGDVEVRPGVQPARRREGLESRSKLKMMQGGKVTGGTLFSATDPATYCAMANAGYDFIWTEMQHDQHDWQAVARMWRTCPHAKAVPGVRVAYTDEREIQHALDAGALGRRRADRRHRRGGASKRGTGPTFRRSGGAATAAARRSTRRCGAACRAAIATRSTTTSS